MPPATVDLTEAARFVQLFKISGLTATKQKPRYTASRAITVGGLDWLIEFDPTADPRLYVSTGDWIMFRARLISEGSGGVAASFSCRLVDPSPTGLGNSPVEVIKSSIFYENRSLDVFLITWSDLESSRYRKPKDDCIFVQCALTVLEPQDAAAGAAAEDAAASVPSSDLHLQLGELLRSQKGADITFIVAGEPVPAHRSVLAARSPVFMAGLFGDMREKASAIVEINDMEVGVFKAMLHFVYTDTVPELEEKGKQATLMAQHLLEAADRYGLERLRRICVEEMCTNIGVDTVATTLALAEQHGCSELKSRCMKFILATTGNLHAVAATEGYKHLEASCPSVLTELLNLMVKGNR
ncbi:unnamed protein product [Urochloa decumbens]|uniref:BTB domain-containing protein n=1 Tax=Urochloa decumbens TaxID=240449 RepID=A0ABC9DJI9_9POAL